MLELTVDDAFRLKQVIEAIGLVCQEANLDCTPNGISLAGMDSGHVSLANLNLKPGFFTTYRCDAACTLGLHFPTFVKVMKCCERNERVTLMHKNNSDELIIKRDATDAIGANYKPATYNIKLIRLDAERLAINESDDGVVIETGSRLMQKMINELQVFGDDIVFECPYIENSKERYVKIMASGDIGKGQQLLRDTSFCAAAVDVKKDPNYVQKDIKKEPKQVKAEKETKKIKVEIKDEEDKENIGVDEMVREGGDDNEEVEENEEDKEKKPISTSITFAKGFALSDQKCSEGQGIRMTYAAQYLQSFCKASNLSTRVSLTISQNPIQMEYLIGDFGRVSFHLAPRYTEEALSQ